MKNLVAGLIDGKSAFGGKQIKCPFCGYSLMTSPMCEPHENFCCNCGADMRGE